MSVEIPAPGTRGAKMPSGLPGRLIMRAMRVVHRISGNKMKGRPLLYLHTVGAKSGAARTSTVMPFPDGDDAWLIVASRGGTPEHPSWLYNLAAHPDQVRVEVEGRKTPVTPRTLEDAERTVAWQRITKEAPQFAEYETKTDRLIPVVRLTAR